MIPLITNQQTSPSLIPPKVLPKVSPECPLEEGTGEPQVQQLPRFDVR